MRAFIADNQTVVPASAAAVSGNVKPTVPKRLAYGARAAQAANPAGAHHRACIALYCDADACVLCRQAAV